MATNYGVGGSNPSLPENFILQSRPYFVPSETNSSADLYPLVRGRSRPSKDYGPKHEIFRALTTPIFSFLEAEGFALYGKAPLDLDERSNSMR